MNTHTSISLWCNEANHDKVYHIYINEDPNNANLYTVDFAYGRRGNTLNTGTKTNSSVSLGTANGIYQKLLAEKTGKGYKVSSSGGSGASSVPAFTTPSTTKQSSGLLPQLLNPISESEADDYIMSLEWGMQEKYNGKRILMSVDASGSVDGSNRDGIIVALPQETVDIIQLLPECEIDGELIGNRYYVFDLLKDTDGDLRELGYRSRYNRLYKLWSPLNSNLFQLAVMAVTPEDKLKLYNDIKARNGEGVVFKRLDSTSVPGRPTSYGDQLKCKFWATATCKVGNINTQRSVQLITSDNKFVGNCTIMVNQEVPSVGDLIEVRYLYAHKNGSLVQPTYLGLRDDIHEADSSTSLKFKPDNPQDADSDDE